MGIRDAMRSNPWVGWTIAGACMLVAAFLLFKQVRGAANPYNFERLTEDVVIKDRETGEEWTLKRGRMEAMLWDRGGKIDPNVGLPNPNTGKLTGFPKSDWEATCERIARDRDEAVAAYGGRVPSGSAKAPKKAPK